MTKQKAKKTKAKKAKSKNAKPAKQKKAVTKMQIVIDLLKRPNGATSADIEKATDWLSHTVRGFISGTLRKKHGYEIVSEKSKDNAHVYKIVTKSK